MIRLMYTLKIGDYAWEQLEGLIYMLIDKLGTSKNSTKPVFFHPETYRGPYKLVFVGGILSECWTLVQHLL